MKIVIRFTAVVVAGLAIALSGSGGTTSAGWCAGGPSANGSCEPINPTR